MTHQDIMREMQANMVAYLKPHGTLPSEFIARIQALANHAQEDDGLIAELNERKHYSFSYQTSLMRQAATRITELTAQVKILKARDIGYGLDAGEREEELATLRAENEALKAEVERLYMNAKNNNTLARMNADQRDTLRAENEALRARLGEAVELVVELCEHEGAEGFSASTRDKVDAFLNKEQSK